MASGRKVKEFFGGPRPVGWRFELDGCRGQIDYVVLPVGTGHDQRERERRSALNRAFVGHDARQASSPIRAAVPSRGGRRRIATRSAGKRPGRSPVRRPECNHVRVAKGLAVVGEVKGDGGLYVSSVGRSTRTSREAGGCIQTDGPSLYDTMKASVSRSFDIRLARAGKVIRWRSAAQSTGNYFGPGHRIRMRRRIQLPNSSQPSDRWPNIRTRRIRSSPRQNGSNPGSLFRTHSGWWRLTRSSKASLRAPVGETFRTNPEIRDAGPSHPSRQHRRRGAPSPRATIPLPESAHI